MLQFTIISGLPEYLQSSVSAGHLRIAQERRALEVETVDLRDYTEDSYRTIDDEPYGGGRGMVLKPEPVWRALKTAGLKMPEAGGKLGNRRASGHPWVILPTPKGKSLMQEDLVRLSKKRHIIFLCSRYKGIDERIRAWVHEEISLGDYVIGGGEAAALVMMEGIARLLQDVVGDKESVETDSYTCGLLSAPTYTRPEEFMDWSVPQVLLSGHHAEINRWRRKQALALTLVRRPDMLAKVELNDEDKKLLSEVIIEQAGRS
ncbi:tRNA (guanosine(37)-N1)-methyltransferase TrmD [candidate division WOR-3 bacterium]|uniref:tRNA (guanine-N(1)-)-methyltransferase n=1 Tax=candidate division WOR-3 bacterium TaxID=2052148 RepID=A0A9D5QBR8_UNCW3|nr:tRNA (guanosine(37)-N1)-methyltransferase TrmD [candidate division WOR-3 bacterium]MBD3363764.1 tRNA (guanosine(37)-N1)-methyltransferase TrmD [candidate division WOR-3 bacterium]